jgi:hypothetical protein
MNQKVVRLSILCLRPIIHILVDCLEVKPSADFTPILRYDVWPPFFRSNLISTCLMGKCFTTLPRDLNGATARNYDVVVSISNNNISAVYLLAPMGVGIMALTHHYVFCCQGCCVPARVHVGGWGDATVHHYITHATDICQVCYHCQPAHKMYRLRRPYWLQWVHQPSYPRNQLRPRLRNYKCYPFIILKNFKIPLMHVTIFLARFVIFLACVEPFTWQRRASTHNWRYLRGNH